MLPDTLSIRIKTSFPGFDLDVAQGMDLEGVTAVFGPSGSGKTTLLRAIAGFERPGAGVIALGRTVWFDAEARVHVPPHRRPVGTVFQEARLFRHLSVEGNLAFAEKRAHARDVQYTFDNVVRAFDLGPLLARRTDRLSGGEVRRVALARTLLTRPRLLLLDEPLSGLDRTRKHSILPYLEDLPRRFGIPALYVSHDIEEVARLADRILVLAGGRVRAHGPATQIIERLDLEPLTGRFEAGVLIEGRVSAHDRRLLLTHVDLDGDTLSMPLASELEPGDRVRLRVRARDVAVATVRPEGISIRNILAGKVAAIAMDAETPFAEIFIDLAAAHLRARVTRAAAEELRLTQGQPVFALVKSVSFEGRLG